MMDAVIKARWTEALRSGEYRQGRETLRRDDFYCCLGVLCDIKDPGLWDMDDYGYSTYDGEEEWLPQSVVLWAGLSREDGISITMPDGSNKNLGQLNDEGTPFEEIADFIEREL